MYLAGTGTVMEAGLVAQAETAAIAVPSGLAGATELLASTTACERLAATIRTCVINSAQPAVPCLMTVHCQRLSHCVTSSEGAVPAARTAGLDQSSQK